jgi:hypothetical protein
MMIAVILTIAVHVLSGVFWAGTTFALARGQGLGAQSLRKPQLGAAAVAVVSGALLGRLTHHGAFGNAERVLALGAAAALLAAAVQCFNVRGPATAQRIAAVLLAVSVLCMVLARYAG